MIRIGLVGAGAIGKSHKEAIVKNSDCELAAVCDLVIEKAQELAAGTNAHVYTDYKTMREQEKLDAVILNLPHFLHKEVTVYFLEHRIPTLIEKPMANSVAECDAMIEASKRTNTPLGVGHVQRYFPCYRKLRQIMQENRLGRLCAVTETRNIDYFTNRPKWFLNKKQAGGGILMNYGAHTLDKMMYTTGLVPEKITAQANNFLTDDTVEATAQILVQFSEGVTGAFTYCGCHVPNQYDIYFYFTNGTAWIQGGGFLWVAEGREPLKQVTDYEGAPMEDQLREFVKLVRGEPNEMATPEYGRTVIAALESAFSQI